jgi:hypothetical protein
MFTLLIHYAHSRLLLPVCLEKARMTFLLAHAGCDVIVNEIGPNKYSATVLGRVDPKDRNRSMPLVDHDYTALLAAVGGLVTLSSRDRYGEKKPVDLFVNDLKDDILYLTYIQRSDFTKEAKSVHVGLPNNCVIKDAINLHMRAKFKLSEFEFKVQETGIIDAMTGCGVDWFGNYNETNLTVPAKGAYPVDDLDEKHSQSSLKSRIVDSGRPNNTVPRKTGNQLRRVRPLVTTFFCLASFVQWLVLLLLG